MADLVLIDKKQLPNVVKVLQLLSEFDQPSTESCSFLTHAKKENQNDIGGKRKRRSVTRDYSIVAKKCIATQRYDAAAAMLDIVCQELNMNSTFIYKAISVILECDSSTSGDNFFQFIRHAKHLQDIHVREVALEYLIYLLRNKNLENFQNLKSLTSELRSNVSTNDVIYPLLKAYMAVFDYLEWRRSPEDTTSKSSADKAIAIFLECLKLPGQWDIFVLKLIEMLEYYERYSDIEAALNEYIVNNPEHVNGYIYLCTHLHKHSPDSDALVTMLKELADRCPSDERVLWLAELIRETDPTEALKLLFIFLDYPSNTDNLKAWSCLSSLLSNLLSHSEFPRFTFKPFWKKRRNIWPHIHFNISKIQLHDKLDAKLAVEKTKVLYIFNTEHAFINAVLERLNEISTELNEDLEHYFDEINRLQMK